MNQNVIGKSFGLVVKTSRERLHISQEALAELAGLHRTYISDIERGFRNVSLKNIEKISMALHFPLWGIFFEMIRIENNGGKYLPESLPVQAAIKSLKHSLKALAITSPPMKILAA